MRRPLCMVTSLLEGRLPWSQCLDALHPIAFRVLHHADRHPETHLRPRPHDLLTGRVHRAEHFI